MPALPAVTYQFIIKDRTNKCVSIQCLVFLLWKINAIVSQCDVVYQLICHQGTMCMSNGSEIVIKNKWDMKLVSITTLMWLFEKIQLCFPNLSGYLTWLFLAYCNRSRRPHSAHLLLTAVYPVQQLTSRGQQRRYYGQHWGHWRHGYLGNGF